MLSYYIPGELEGVDLTFLLDSGCTTNLVTRYMGQPPTSCPRHDPGPRRVWDTS